MYLSAAQTELSGFFKEKKEMRLGGEVVLEGVGVILKILCIYV